MIHRLARVAIALSVGAVALVPSTGAAHGDAVAESKNFRLIESIPLGGADPDVLHPFDPLRFRRRR